MSRADNAKIKAGERIYDETLFILRIFNIDVFDADRRS